MVLYRMIGRDPSSCQLQYRVWQVQDNPDYSGSYYTGVQSSSHHLEDIFPYWIPDGYYQFNFNYPVATEWVPYPVEFSVDFPIQFTLPEPVEDSQLAVIDGYAYLFGSKVSNNIFMTTNANPNLWSIVGQLPLNLYGSSLAIVGSEIYLFGGADGYNDDTAVSTILSAPISNPLNWSVVGNLPINLCYSNLWMYNGELYLFGGLNSEGKATNIILTANTSNPLAWTVNGATLPYAIYGACLAQINGLIYLYGGETAPNTPVTNIASASIIAPTIWNSAGFLPYATSFGQFFTTGVDGYFLGPMIGEEIYTGFTTIIQCHLETPTTFFNVPQAIPGTATFIRGLTNHSALAILQDRVWVYGGSGSSAMFACAQQVKYDCLIQGGKLSYMNSIINYAVATRINLPAINNAINPFEALSFAIWRTDYSALPPPTPPIVPNVS
jgi:hypothetical protein